METPDLSSDEILADLEALRREARLKELEAKVETENKLALFEPYAPQAEFFEATADFGEVALRAGNQQGKTLSAAYMATVFATGLYPDWWTGRRFPGPTRGWVTGESTQAVRDVQQHKLCGPPNNPELLGTGLIPKDRLLKTVLGHGTGGAFDQIQVRHVSGGVSEIGFRTYEMDRSKWQGATLDWVWFDEEPDLEHYEEGLARLIATNGVAFSTFTPLNGMALVLPRFMERTPEALANRRLIAMRLDDAKHLADPKARERLLATFPAHQRRARIDGLPLLGSGAVFEDVQLDELVESYRLAGDVVIHPVHGPMETGHWAKLWGIDFGIDHPFAAVLLGWDRDTDIVRILAEVKIKGGVPDIHAARMLAIAGNVPVAWPHDGNQRDKGSGEALAAIYKRAGLLMRPTHATLKTGGYSTEAGIMEMLTRMRSSRFKVFGACREWQDEFSMYHRKDGQIVKMNDDLLSATRVGIMDLRFAKAGPLTSGRGPTIWSSDGSHIGGRTQMAKNVDFDLFN